MPKTFATLGQHLVNQILPKDLQDESQLSKGTLHDKIRALARRDTVDAAPRIEALRALGHELATTEGISASLADITPDYKTRERVLRPYLTAVQQTNDVTKRRELIRQAQPKLLEATKSHPGSFGIMVRSGARGKPVQLMKDVAAPVMALEASGDPYPWLIRHSYAEGLRNSEMWAANTETRNNQIDTRLAVTEPGDLAKILVNNMTDQLITVEDCKTNNGTSMSASDPQIVDRYLARSAGGVSAGSLVTQHILTKLKKSNVTNVLARSPMTCEATDGVCQKCFGLNHRGRVHSLGTNVGVIGAQAISEPLTQFALSAKHGTRSTVADKSIVRGHRGLRQLLDVPEAFPNKAALAPFSGKVTDIRKAPQGGTYITTTDADENARTYAPPGLMPKVQVGQKVEAGDVLSQGIVNPAELVTHKGIGAGRRYITDSLYDVYKQQGVDVDKRHLELLARAHINHVRIDDDPQSRFQPGEVVAYNSFLRRLAEDVKTTAIGKAEGKLLAKGYGDYSAGIIVTPTVIHDLKKQGVKQVKITPEPPSITPIMRPITRNPALHPDWMARLGTRGLRQSMLEAVHFGQQSNIHGIHPIPALAYGVEFGEGKGPRY